MKRWQQVALLLLIPAVIVGGLLVGRALSDGDGGESAIGIEPIGDDGEFDHDYLIPEGTAERIAAGEQIEIVPAELTVEVGDTIRIRNDDSDDHLVGVFFVAAGEQLTYEFSRAGTLEGECTVHPSGAFTLHVEA